MSVVKLYSVEAQEDAGELVSAVVVYDVEIPYAGQSPEDIVGQALSYVPVVGASFSTANPYLAVTRRSPKIIKPRGGNNLVAVLVAVEYELWRLRDGIPESGSTSLEQIQSMVDRDGTQITVQYGNTIKPVTIDVPDFKSTFHETAIYAVYDPKALSKAMTNSVNAYAWRNEPAETILCTQTDYQCVNRASNPKLWRFDCDFEIKRTGWLYKASFKLADGTYPSPQYPATVNIRWHYGYDFAAVFG